METENHPEVKKSSFSWLRIGKIILVIIILAALATGGYFGVTFRPVKVAWASWVMDRHEDYLDCYGLPFYPQAQKALVQHPDAVAKLKTLGVTNVEAVEMKCQGWSGGVQFIKGDILINYHTREEKQAVEKFLGKDFYGISYEGRPVK